MFSRGHSEVKALILLEHEEQVKDCLHWLDKIEGRKQVIALTPFAMYELDRHEVPYKIPEDYYDPQELYQMGIDNFQKVEKFCSIIDRSIQQSCPSMAEFGIRPALFSFRHLIVIYDSLTIRMFQLFKLFDIEKPDIIFVYASKHYPFGAHETAPYLLFDNRESIYAHLLTLDGWRIKVKVLPPVSQPEDSYFEKVNHRNFLDRVKEKGVTWVKTHPSLFDISLAIRKKGWHGLLDWLKKLFTRRAGNAVLLFGGAYNWDDCREEMQLQGIGPIFRITDDFHWLNKAPQAGFKTALSAWNNLQKDEEFRGFFIWRVIDFFPVIKERVRFLMERLTPVCLTSFQRATKLIKRKGIKAGISSTLATCVAHSVAQAAHGMRIPVITWQHGAYGTANHPFINYTDLMRSDAHFVFGEGVAEQYAESARRFNTKLFSVGSASLEKLQKIPPPEHSFRGINLKKKIILYVTTNYYQMNVLISTFPPPSDNLLWHTQQAIADVLGKHDEYSVIVKLHPSSLYREPPLRVYAEERAFHNFQFIRREHPFTELLPMADVIVCDLPSTTLLQALTTTKPVFVYLGHQHMDEQARILLERRAVCHQDLQSFANALDEYLATGNIETIDLNNREFLKEYGIMLYEGTAGNRAAKALKQIIESWEAENNDFQRDRKNRGKD